MAEGDFTKPDLEGYQRYADGLRELKGAPIPQDLLDQLLESCANTIEVHLDLIAGQHRILMTLLSPSKEENDDG